MVVNPKKLGLDPLRSESETAHDALVEQHHVLTDKFHDLVNLAKSYRVAYELYQNSMVSPMGYNIALESMGYTSPSQLINMYETAESTYRHALSKYQSTTRALYTQCVEHLDENRKEYLTIILDLVQRRAELVSMEPHNALIIEDTEIYQDLPRTSLENYLNSVVANIRHHKVRDLRSRPIYDVIVKNTGLVSEQEEQRFASMKNDLGCPSYRQLRISQDSMHKKIINLVWYANDNQYQKQDYVINISPIANKTYRDLGYTIKNTILRMYEFHKDAVDRSKLERVAHLLSNRDPKNIATSLKLGTEAMYCLAIYNTLDHLFYRMGRDIQSTLA